MKDTLTGFDETFYLKIILGKTNQSKQLFSILLGHWPWKSYILIGIIGQNIYLYRGIFPIEDSTDCLLIKLMHFNISTGIAFIVSLMILYFSIIKMPNKGDNKIFQKLHNFNNTDLVILQIDRMIPILMLN